MIKYIHHFETKVDIIVQGNKAKSNCFYQNPFPMEFAFLGKSVIALPQNDMERSFLRLLEEKGYLLQGLEASFCSMNANPAMQMFQDETLREHIAETGMNIIDGQGCSRIADILLDIIKK